MTTNVLRRCASIGVPTHEAIDVISCFHHSVGWDPAARRLAPSAVLCAGTWDEVVDASAEGLARSGLAVSRDEVRRWHGSLGDIHSDDSPLVDDLPGFLRRFRRRGMVVAICTSDDRACTDACMRK